MKIKVNIPEFGERFCSSDIEYKLFNYEHGYYYIFFKKGTNVRHNEYGPSLDSKYGICLYRINNKLHRLNDYAYYDKNKELIMDNKEYHVIGKLLGTTKEKFIKKLANVLIPKNKKYL